MRFPKLPFPSFWLPFALAIGCAAVAVINPITPGIRIPVSCGKNGDSYQMVYIDDHGKMVLPARWRYASAFGPDGLGHVSGPGYWSISRTGGLAMLQPPPPISERDPRFRSIGPDEQGMILIWRYDRETNRYLCHWTLRDGSPAFPGEWVAALPFGPNNLAAVGVAGEWGFINRQGETVLPHEWDATLGFTASGLACVARNGRWGAIDATGKLTVPLHFSSITGFDAAGMALVRIGGGCGFINTTGRIVIPLIYQSGEPFDSAGMARVVRNFNQQNKAGWIDREGRTKVPFEYEPLKPQWFVADHPRLLPVMVGPRGGLIDREGKWVVPLGSGRISLVNDPLAPGREWYVRAPDWEDRSKPPPPPFVPACYDENGRLIWSITGWGLWGRSWLDRRESFALAAGVFGLWWLIAVIRHRRKLKRDASTPAAASPFLTILKRAPPKPKEE